jgi:hypothetical protein
MPKAVCSQTPAIMSTSNNDVPQMEEPAGAGGAASPLHEAKVRGASSVTAPINVPPPELDEVPRPEEQQLHLAEGGGKFEATLQPVDEGFGAWSYVASAFAMYIVVWGEP